MKPYTMTDLTHVLIPGKEQYTVEIKPRGKPRTGPTGDIMHDVSMWSHSGTHVEVGRHFYADGSDVKDIPLDRFIGPAIRLDFRSKGVNEPISVEDFMHGGQIKEGDIVIMWQGRDTQYRTPQSHDRPYVTYEAAQWLIHDRKIKCLGTDSSGFEVRGRNDHPNHHLFFKKDVDVPVIECLRNLGAIPSQRFFFTGAPIPVTDMDASPIRAVALTGGAFEGV